MQWDQINWPTERREQNKATMAISNTNSFISEPNLAACIRLNDCHQSHTTLRSQRTVNIERENMKKYGTHKSTKNMHWMVGYKGMPHLLKLRGQDFLYPCKGYVCHLMCDNDCHILELVQQLLSQIYELVVEGPHRGDELNAQIG